MVARTNERTAFHHAESFFQGILPVPDENFGFDEFDHLQVMGGGLKVLTDGQYPASYPKQVIHGFKDLRFCFTQPYHDA
jgi:hypothetical protein